MIKMTEKEYFDAIHTAETVDEKLDLLFSDEIEVIVDVRDI